ncbi:MULTISPECIES: hypothetical protein [Thiomonas]|nr:MULTISPECIES: hypothetical protein [Thiomonas]
MNLRKRMIVQRTTVVGEERLEHCLPFLVQPPVLLVNDVDQRFEERDRRIWEVQAALILLPIATVQIFRDVGSTRTQRTKVAAEAPHDVLRSV